MLPERFESAYFPSIRSGIKACAATALFILLLSPHLGCSRPHGPQLSIHPAQISLEQHEIGEMLEFRLRAKNIGSETLELKAIKTSCPCFRYSFAPRSLKPGQSMELAVEFMTSGRPPGSVKEFVVVASNDSDTPNSSVTVSASLAGGLWATPGGVTSFAAGASDLQERITVFTDMHAGFTLKKIDAQDPRVGLSFGSLPRRLGVGDVFVIDALVNSPSNFSETVRDVIVIHAVDHHDDVQKRYLIPVFAKFE